MLQDEYELAMRRKQQEEQAKQEVAVRDLEAARISQVKAWRHPRHHLVAYTECLNLKQDRSSWCLWSHNAYLFYDLLIPPISINPSRQLPMHCRWLGRRRRSSSCPR